MLEATEQYADCILFVKVAAIFHFGEVAIFETEELDRHFFFAILHWKDFDFDVFST